MLLRLTVPSIEAAVTAESPLMSAFNVLRVHAFGRLHVRGNGGVISGSAVRNPGASPSCPWALLASAGEQGLTREKVLAYLWTDTEEERARRGLNQALYALRQDLGSDDVFLGSSRDLRLNPDLVSSDVGEFEQAVGRGNRGRRQPRRQHRQRSLDGFPTCRVPPGVRALVQKSSGRTWPVATPNRWRSWRSDGRVRETGPGQWPGGGSWRGRTRCMLGWRSTSCERWWQRKTGPEPCSTRGSTKC